jgi:hypothetical protein
MKKLLLPISLILNLCFFLPFSGIIPAEPVEPHSPERYEFFLKPEKGAMQLFLNYDMARTGTTFLKEPDFFRQGKIIRNSFLIPGKSLPFAWDKKTAKLYIDFNRNLDLTDDPDNVFEASEKTYAHIFRDIPIDVVIKDTPVRYFVDIQLYLTGSFYGYLEVKTSWAGDIDLPHIKARMMVADDLNGEIPSNKTSANSVSDKYRLIPLDFKDHPTSYPVQSFSNMFVQFPTFKGIFLNDQAYDLDYEFVKNEGEVLLKVTFTETHPNTITLKFAGNYIKQAILYGDYHVILFSPSQKETIPSGNYTRSTIYVQKDPSNLELNANMMTPFSIKEGETYILEAGAPLRNKISVSRTRTRLNLNYELVGFGGEHYQRIDYQNPPEFTVFQGDKRIFSDKFSFG